jgi:hypothetical protein
MSPPGIRIGGGLGMAAIPWSSAAALHAGLGPAVVFHPAGYKGGAASFPDNFSQGRYFGVSLLEWMGPAASPPQAAGPGFAPYPRMARWLRA